MADRNDMDLLREYADHNSEPAFAELVQRHINLEYSVALRWAGNSSDAQDETQAEGHATCAGKEDKNKNIKPKPDEPSTAEPAS